MHPRNGPSLSNAGVSRVGPPDFKSFRKKRKLSIGDVIIWSESGKETYQGKSKKKRVRKKRSNRKRKRSARTSNKTSRHREAQKRAHKKERKIRDNKLIKIIKKAAVLVRKRAERLERLLHEIKHGKPKKRSKKAAPKPTQQQAIEHVTSRLELIQSILWKRRGQKC
jgi:hypothetical protein